MAEFDYSDRQRESSSHPHQVGTESQLPKCDLDVVTVTVGALEENAYVVRATARARSALMIDPGDEPERLCAAVAALGVELEAILITHCHFDHVGAVAPVARESDARVYCPAAERETLARIMDSVPPGFGPYDGYAADLTVAGGERLVIAGLEIEVLSAPGHSPGHVVYAIAPLAGSPPLADATADARPTAGAPALFAGDVIFSGAVGRCDLPGGSWPELKRTLSMLLRRFPEHTVVYPGHNRPTTLGRECASSSLLSRLATPDVTPRS